MLVSKRQIINPLNLGMVLGKKRILFVTFFFSWKYVLISKVIMIMQSMSQSLHFFLYFSFLISCFQMLMVHSFECLKQYTYNKMSDRAVGLMRKCGESAKLAGNFVLNAKAQLTFCQIFPGIVHHILFSPLSQWCHFPWQCALVINSDDILTKC